MRVPDSYKKAVGRRIAETRQARGLTQPDLERLTGLARNRIGNYEQGTRLPAPPEVILLATALGVPSAYLLCLEGEDMVVVDKGEQEFLRNWRALLERERTDYARRIAALATAYRDPVPDERVARFISPAPDHLKS